MKNGAHKSGTVARALKAMALVVFASAGVMGCQPRGESHTLDQIFSDARSTYVTDSAHASGDMRSVLSEVTGQLDTLAGAGATGADAKVVTASVATSLDGLMGKIGVTARPAMAELITQYRVASTGSSNGVGAPALKLLAARTYMLLAAELRTSNFRG